MKKTNNKGFSLVELIIVIAIMVILVAVIAPQYTKFVYNSRISTDVQTAAEMATDINTRIANGEDVASIVSGYVNTPSKLNKANGTWVITYNDATGVSEIKLTVTEESADYVCYPNPDSASGLNKLKK